MFGVDLPKYTLVNRCLEKADLEMGDETTKIFLNTKGICDTIEPELKALLTYMCNGQATTDLTKDIETQIIKARANARWRGDFMTLYEHYQIERNQGREEGRFDAVTKLIKKGYSIEDACDLLDFDVVEYKTVVGDKGKNKNNSN